VQRHTDAPLGSDYFEYTLLPRFQREVKPLPGVYYEPRGTMHEPLGGRVVPLGTREVEGYAIPSWTYDKVLFIEKTGLWEVVQAARLADRYDLAVVAGQGFSSVAARVLLARAEAADITIFVVHDADIDGYNIARTLSEETARMPGHAIGIVDLGLTVERALELGLEFERFTRTRDLPAALELSDVAYATLVERRERKTRADGKQGWRIAGRRCELNALSSPKLIEYIELGLAAAGATGKVVPPQWAITAEAEAAAEELLHAAAQVAVRGALEEALPLDAMLADLTRRLAADHLVPLQAAARDIRAEEVRERLERARLGNWAGDVHLRVEALVAGYRDQLRQGAAVGLEAVLKDALARREDGTP